MRRPVDAKSAQAVQTDFDGVIASAKGHEQVHPQAGHARHLRRSTGAACEIGEARFRVSERTREKFAFGPVELEREGEIMTMFPSVCWQQRAAGGEIAQRRQVRSRVLGAPACNQVQLGKPLALPARADERAPAVELSDDLEHALLDRTPRDLCCEPPANGKVHRSSLALRNQCIRRFPHAVVQKPVDAILSQQDARSHRRPKGRVHVIFGLVLNERQGGGRRSAAEAG